MRHVKDHKDELCSHTSTLLGPAAPMTCASGPFSCRGAACTSRGGGLWNRPFPAAAVGARRGFASLLVCFIAVNPELPLLRDARSPLFLHVQKHLQNTGSFVEGFFSLPPDFLSAHIFFCSEASRRRVPALAGCAQDRSVPSGTFLSAQPGYTYE